MSQVKRVNLEKNIWKDERGWGTSPIEAVGMQSELLGSIHVAQIKPGCKRGNHYHTHSTEWLLIFGGPAKFYWRSNSENSIREEIISEAEPALFEIPPYVEHTILNDSNGDIFLMAFSNSNERDTVRSTLV
jgi:dTDP-4-dehydrorhamnose 3,5-epimerase-like enzyme